MGDLRLWTLDGQMLASFREQQYMGREVIL
jgi:hypothetical protein